jgi:hypothetical protein
MQHFFAWYAPRVPHQPLRSPQPVIDYLFGAPGIFPTGGAMNLGQWCSGGSCAPVVQAFGETNFGTVREFFGNIWWADDNVRELRRFLAEETKPHCIGANGRSRFDVANAGACASAGGVWSSVTPDLERNTIIIYLSDNGWHLRIRSTRSRRTATARRSSSTIRAPCRRSRRGTRSRRRAAAELQPGARALDGHAADGARLRGAARRAASLSAEPRRPRLRRQGPRAPSRDHARRPGRA